MKLILKRLVGVVLTSAGALLLTKALEAALGDTPPSDLPLRANVATISGVILLLLGAVVVAAVAFASKPGQRSSNAAPVALILSTPIGVAFSVAVSLWVSAAIEQLLKWGPPAVVTVLGFLFLVLGVWLSYGFWGKLFREFKAYLEKARRPSAG